MPAYWGLLLLLLGCAAAVPWPEIGDYEAAEWEWLAEEGLAAAVAAQAAMDVAVASESVAGLRQAETLASELTLRVADRSGHVTAIKLRRITGLAGTCAAQACWLLEKGAFGPGVANAIVSKAMSSPRPNGFLLHEQTIAVLSPGDYALACATGPNSVGVMAPPKAATCLLSDAGYPKKSDCGCEVQYATSKSSLRLLLTLQGLFKLLRPELGGLDAHRVFGAAIEAHASVYAADAARYGAFEQSGQAALASSYGDTRRYLSVAVSKLQERFPALATGRRQGGAYTVSGQSPPASPTEEPTGVDVGSMDRRQLDALQRAMCRRDAELVSVDASNWKVYLSASRLNNLHHAPAWLIRLFKLVPDYILHVLKLRSYIDKEMGLNGIELPLTLAELHAARLQWADDIAASAEAADWDLPPASSSPQTPCSCVAAALEPALWMTANDRKSLGYGYRQSNGHAADAAVAFKHSIAHCFPEAVREALEVKEEAWRFVFAVVTDYEPTITFGKQCGAITADLADALEVIGDLSGKLFVPLEKNGFRSVYRCVCTY
eukprot:COSAG01_NODE_142_length_24198_cov_8.924893_5_plen_548_part_00